MHLSVAASRRRYPGAGRVASAGLGEPLPLSRHKIVDLLVQVPDLELGLEADRVVVLRSQPVFGILAPLAHHDDRSLKRSNA